MKSVHSAARNSPFPVWLVLSAIAFAGVAAAAGYDSAPRPAASQEQKPDQKTGKEVGIDNFSFKPNELVVAAGTRVTWINHDDTPHIVVSVDKHFTSSPALDTGDQYSYVFDKPGSYEYFCSLHPKMVGRVIVN
jgi:plastocyanin